MAKTKVTLDADYNPVAADGPKAAFIFNADDPRIAKLHTSRAAWKAANPTVVAAAEARTAAREKASAQAAADRDAEVARRRAPQPVKP